MVVFSLVSAIIAGVVIELFFQLIKYADSLNKNGPIPVYREVASTYLPLYQPFGYMTVVDFLSGGKRRWGLYFLFRLLPPLLILLLLAGILSRYAPGTNVLLYLVIAASVSVIPRDVARIFFAKYISEKLIHTTNSLLIYVIAVGVGIWAQLYDLSFFAPSVSGLFDNLWSSLFVAVIALMYARITSPPMQGADEKAAQTARDNYVVESYGSIHSKHAAVIDEAIAKYGCSKPILYAVLIYENMNRPKWMRRSENLLVRVFRLELTVGLAQVKSDKPLSDAESIVRAAHILQGSSFADSGYGSGFVDLEQLESILKNYNSSNLYAESVAEIMSALRKYAPEVYPSYFGSIYAR